MEIIRSRLCNRDYFNGEKYFHEMGKKRSKRDQCIDIQPIRAKRKLFEDTPSQNEDSAEKTGETLHNLRRGMEGECLENRFSHIEVFKNPPHPYRTVRHSASCAERYSESITVGETENFDRVPSSSRSVSQSQRQSSPHRSQTQLQDYFKAKKRPRLSSEQHKTPESARLRKCDLRAKEEQPPSVDGL